LTPFGTERPVLVVFVIDLVTAGRTFYDQHNVNNFQ
jgi:hypothetical protein